jgi:glycosyltransferase involved in cell wall biosynthesis
MCASLENPLPKPAPSRVGWLWNSPGGPQVDDSTARPWPRVSIVTPSYNQAEYLEQTIRSILLQRYPYLEYTVMDGGSTDGSVDLIRRYESYLTSWVSEPDRGQSHAINNGWVRATGEIIAYLNSDDYYLPGAIHTSVRYLMDHPEIDLVYGSVLHVDESGHEFARIRPPRYTLPRLVHSCFIAQPSVFLRRALYERLGPLDESIHHSFDYEYWLRASNIASFAMLPVFSAGVRYHQSSKSSSQLVRFFLDEVTIFDRLFGDGTLDRSDESLVITAYLRRLLYIAGAFSGASEEQRASAIGRLQRMVPRPSLREITNAVAGHDAFLRGPYVGTDLAERAPVDHSPFIDAAGVIPVLREAGIVDSGENEKLAGRVQLCATVQENARSPVVSPWEVMAGAVMSTIHDPAVWFCRAWWLALGRSVAPKRALDFLIPLVRAMAPPLRTLLTLGKLRGRV